MAKSVGVSSEIVVEVLRQKNYANWRACMKSYLLAQDLWDVIEITGRNHPNDDDLEWRKRNAAALHAIQVSCSPDVLSHIRNTELAKEAWGFLAETYGSEKSQIEDYELCILSYDHPQYKDFMDAAERGDWDSAQEILQNTPHHVPISIIGAMTYNGILTAIRAGHENFVELLVQNTWEHILGIQTSRGYRTSLHIAAITGMIRSAVCIAKKNARLLHYEDDNAMIPVTLAAWVGNEEMTRYLCSITSSGDLTAKEGFHGATLISYCIAAKIFDVALHLLQQCPSLAFRLGKDGITPIYALAQVPSAFRGGVRFGKLQGWIYACIRVQPLQPSNDISINICEYYDNESHDRNWSHVIQEWLRYLRRLVFNLLNILGGVRLYKIKSTHIQANQLLNIMLKDIREYGDTPTFIHEALSQAVSNGITELFDSVIKANPYILLHHPKKMSNLLILAIKYRQKKIFSIISGLMTQEKSLASYVASKGNDMLFVAGFLAPPNRLQGIPGPVFQLQSELRWFKEVEEIVHPKCKEVRNPEGFTPGELFTENHKSLKKEGEEWIKETARSSTVVGALIMTITFAAIFTVPGGNDQNTGFPIFLHRKLFMVFIIADAISLVSSSASVLMFLEILTSSYAEDDFLKTLPNKIIFGLAALWFSVLALMVAFWAALNVMKHGKIWLIVTSLLASLPIIINLLSPSKSLIKLIHW